MSGPTDRSLGRGGSPCPPGSAQARGSVARTLRTARRIPLAQLAARARFLWLRRRYALDRTLPLARAAVDAAGMTPVDPLPRVPDAVLWPEGLDEVRRRADAFAHGRFAYLHREADFAGGIRWRDADASPLWLYQLHYLGAVADLARAGLVADSARVLTSWRADFETRWDETAWHPYTASLRLVNLCVAAACAGGFEALGPGAGGLVAAHAAFLLRHVEHDVRGNHLLENARALIWAARCFRGGAAGECDRMARSILEREIAEQVLPDGGHFELSPMYHCVVMRDLLEVRALLGDGDPLVAAHVTPALARMARFLDGVLCPDGGIPLLGDSVRGFAPPPLVLLALAGATPQDWSEQGRVFADTGLVVFARRRTWTIVDCGRVCPSYLPAHGQADSLTFELWIDGARVVCDPGVHDYSGPERAWGRSSRAHSTLTVDDADTSEVFGSFRVGGRSEVEWEARDYGVDATLRPYGSDLVLRRALRSHGTGLVIDDTSPSPGARTVRSRVHLDPAVRIVHGDDESRRFVVETSAGRVAIEASGPVVRERGRASHEFGRVEETTILAQALRAERPGDDAVATWRFTAGDAR